MNVRALLAAAGLFALAPSCRGPRDEAPAPARPVEGWREAASATWRVRWRFEPDPPVSGESARLVLTAFDRAGVAPEELRADAGMPQHAHGLLRRPTVAVRAPGHFTVEGLYLHMPGSWVLYLDLGRRGVFERVEIALELD